MKTILNKYIIMVYAALLSLTANAAKPDWTSNASDYEYDMTVFAALSINGQTVAPNDYILAAFCGDECRGVATVASSNGNDYYYLRVRSNVKSGETITFRAYNKTADEEVKQHWLLTSLPFTADEMTGYPSIPFTVMFQVPTYTVSVEASPYGTIEGGGDFVESTEATFTAVPNEGYKFVSWYDGSTVNPLVIQVLGNMNVSATFAPETYTVTYMIGQEVIRIDEVEYGTALTAIEAPAKEGHTFDGWTGLPETMPAHDVMVTGSYTVNTYTLIFKIGDDVVSEATIAYGSEIIEPTVPEKEGHTFAGWDEHPITMPASNLTINGSYSINIYTVTYKIDDEIIRVDYVEFGATLPEAPKAPEKQGYDFDGWSDIPETMPAKDIIIIGKYIATTGISSVSSDSAADVFDIQGHLVKKNVVLSRIAEYLPKGIYIINRKKVLIK